MQIVFSKKLLTLAVTAAILGISACNDSDSDPDPEPTVVEPRTAPERCADLLDVVLPDTNIILAQIHDASDDVPEYCEVLGSINERVSQVDGQNYAIRFQLSLPTNWNGRFYYSGGGGTDGNVGAADIPVIAEGFAFVSTDSGHDSATNRTELAGDYQFGFDPQARSDYGYNGPAQVTEKTKLVTELFYEDPIDYSYFVCCSEGGR